ncbi:MAG: hypothetical protein Q9219_001998 [cf. Caloplaca sp. 3 TL-2023]
MPELSISDVSLSVTEHLVPSAPPDPSSVTTISFSGLLNPPLRLQNDPTECGGHLWPGGMVLAKYLLRCKMPELKGKTILALSLHPIQPIHIHLTDLPPILPLLDHNISLNPVRTSTSAHILEWGSPVPTAVPTSPDVLLAADCVYFEPAFPLLLQMMQELMGPHTVCYFCFKKRRRADMGFVKMARKVFEVKDVKDDPDKEVWGREGLHL